MVSPRPRAGADVFQTVQTMALPMTPRTAGQSSRLSQGMGDDVLLAEIDASAAALLQQQQQQAPASAGGAARKHSVKFAKG